MMPPRTRYYYDRFVDLANVDDLHPLDWERFYHFVWIAHLGRCRLDVGGLRQQLVQDGFDDADAESLADIYETCREFMQSRRTMHYLDRSEWARQRASMPRLTSASS